MDIASKLHFPTFEKGHVWLVGAGPGDPKLLTLYAFHGLQHADVIVHDALVDQEILNLASPKAKLEHMGKRGGKSSPKQEEITTRLSELANSGLRVLRLKGGDPFVFGRGAEEAVPLIEAGIQVKIIPGISAGIGGAAYAGVPVSDGRYNQVISFVTGHNRSGNVPEVDWQALAKSSPVIVFYMPMNHLEKIRDELIKAGRYAEEAVCFVSNASTPNQKECISTLKMCVQDAQKADIRAPALMIVGPTVALRDKLLDCFRV